jgi:hypothetical protein
MKPCHAAALALIGWYLMLLPPNDPMTGTFPIDWSANQRSFDTAKECEEARAKTPVPPDKETGAAINRLLSRPSAVASPVVSTRAFFCIASDDPRLK